MHSSFDASQLQMQQRCYFIAGCNAAQMLASLLVCMVRHTSDNCSTHFQTLHTIWFIWLDLRCTTLRSTTTSHIILLHITFNCNHHLKHAPCLTHCQSDKWSGRSISCRTLQNPKKAKWPTAPATLGCVWCKCNQDDWFIFVNTCSMWSPAHAHELYSLNNYVLTDTFWSLCSLIQWSSSDFQGNNAHLIPDNANTIMPRINLIFDRIQPSTTWSVEQECLVPAEVGIDIIEKQMSQNNCWCCYPLTEIQSAILKHLIAKPLRQSSALHKARTNAWPRPWSKCWPFQAWFLESRKMTLQPNETHNATLQWRARTPIIPHKSPWHRSKHSDTTNSWRVVKHRSAIIQAWCQNALTGSERMYVNSTAAAAAAAALPARSSDQTQRMKLAMCVARTLPGTITCITPMTRFYDKRHNKKQSEKWSSKSDKWNNTPAHADKHTGTQNKSPDEATEQTNLDFLMPGTEQRVRKIGLQGM